MNTKRSFNQGKVTIRMSGDPSQAYSSNSTPKHFLPPRFLSPNQYAFPSSWPKPHPQPTTRYDWKTFRSCNERRPLTGTLSARAKGHQYGSMQNFPTNPACNAFKVRPWRYASQCNLAMPPTTTARSFECVFCKRNGEPFVYYTSHQIRDINQRITCPVLRRHVCRFCGATGDRAHTDNYCPRNPDRGHALVKQLHMTAMQSTGQKRK